MWVLMWLGVSEWGWVHWKTQKTYSKRREEFFIYGRKNKINIPLPQFEYQPLKTFPASCTPLWYTETLIKPNRTHSRNKLREGLRFLGLLPKRLVYCRTRGDSLWNGLPIRKSHVTGSERRSELGRSRLRGKRGRRRLLPALWSNLFMSVTDAPSRMNVNFFLPQFPFYNIIW